MKDFRLVFFLVVGLLFSQVSLASIHTDEVRIDKIGSYKVLYASNHVKDYIDNSGHSKNKTREMISEIATREFYLTAFGFDTEESKIDGNQGIDLFYEDDLHYLGDAYVVVHECKFHGRGGKPKLSKVSSGVRQMSSDWLAEVARRACDDEDDDVDVCVSMENVNRNLNYAIRVANVFDNTGTNTFFSIVDDGATTYTPAETHFYRLLKEQLSSYRIRWGDLKKEVVRALN